MQTQEERKGAPINCSHQTGMVHMRLRSTETNTDTHISICQNFEISWHNMAYVYIYFNSNRWQEMKR